MYEKKREEARKFLGEKYLCAKKNFVKRKTPQTDYFYQAFASWAAFAPQRR